MNNIHTTKNNNSVQEILDNCLVFWTLRNVPRPRANEMCEELDQHLRIALADGKSIQDVVGSDVQAFAESWAQEARQVPSLFSRIFGIFTTFLIALSIFIITRHVFELQIAFPFTLTLLVSALLLTGLVYVILLPALAFSSPRTEWKSWHYWISFLGILGLFAFEIITRFTGFDQKVVFFTWQWPLSIILAVCTLILNWIAIQRDPTRPQKRT